MPYLYGDSTPFPLDEDFIDTIQHLIKTGVEMLSLQEKIERSERKTVTVETELSADLAKLEELSLKLQETLEPHASDANVVDRRTATHILDAAKTTIAEAREGCERKAQSSRNEIQAALEGYRAEVHRALEAFFAEHELPHTEWEYRWCSTAAGPARMVAIGRHEFGLTVTMELAIPASHLLSRTRKVSDLHDDVRAAIPEAGGLLHRAGLRLRSLSGYQITQIECAAKTITLVVSKNAKPDAPTFQIRRETCADAAPTLTRLQSVGVEKAYAQLGSETAPLGGLLHKVEHELRNLASERRALLNVELKGLPKEPLDQPSALVEKMISAVAPLVLEIRRRTSAHGELVLKRDLGNGRREELFVPRKELAARVATLRPEYRQVFAPFALSRETILIADGDFSKLTTDETSPPAAATLVKDPS